MDVLWKRFPLSTTSVYVTEVPRILDRLICRYVKTQFILSYQLVRASGNFNFYYSYNSQIPGS